jgi:hypothetical protein
MRHIELRRKPRLACETMRSPIDPQKSHLPAPKSEGNPEGKGVHVFLDDWRATEPRDVVAKPHRQVLAELFTSMLVLSAAFKYRPVQGHPNYLYRVDGQWSLSLIAPQEWSEKRREGFVGTCVLQRDMTWTIVPSGRLSENSALFAAIRRFAEAFVDMFDTDLTLEEILPFYAGKLPYYQRLHASALSRSVRAAVTRGDQASMRGRQWLSKLPRPEYELLAHSG